jgi:hypothetical protein
MAKIGELYLTLSQVAKTDFEINLLKHLRDIQLQLNGLSEGRIANNHQAQTTIPTTGSYAQGDMVEKSNPVEAGVAGAKYVVKGWLCVASGSPGTLVEMRVLTGN